MLLRKMYIYAVLCLHVHMDVEYSFLFCCCCKYCTYARGMWIICLIRYTWKLWPACTLRNCIKKKFIHSQWMQIPWNKKMQVFSINNDWKHSFIFFQQCSINAVQMKALSWGGVRDTIYCTVLCNCWTLSRIDYDKGHDVRCMEFFRLHKPVDFFLDLWLMSHKCP